MANTIITKNSSTASAVPTSGDLVQGELAVNVTDKRLFTEDSGGNVVEVGTNPSTMAVAGNATVGGTLGVTGVATLTANPVLSAGTANGLAFLNASKVLTSGSALNYASGTGVGNLLEVTGGSNNVNGQLNIQGTDGTNTSFVSLLSGLEPTNLPSVMFNNGLRFAIATNKAASGYSEQMRLTSTGLGIGTSSPSQKLHVVADTSGALFQGATLGGVTFLKTGQTGMQLFSDATGTLKVYDNNAGATALTLASGNLGLGVTPSAWDSSLFKVAQIGVTGAFISGRANAVNQAQFGLNTYYDGAYKYVANGNSTRYEQNTGAHYWYTAPSGTAGNAISFTQAMTLDASGNLALGATSASQRLEVVSSVSPFARFRSTASAFTGVDIGQNNAGAGIIDVRDSQPLIFYTADTERARIDSSGNLLVGKTTYGATGGVSVAPDVSGLGFGRIYMNSGYGAAANSITFDYNGTGVGFIQQSTTGVSYNTSSDYRLKNVIGTVSGSGERIDALEPVEYEWKSDGSRARGFLAHKFQEVYAGSVTGSKDAVDEEGKPVYQAMQAGSSEVIADLVAEIQSLRKRLAAAGIA